MGVLRLEAVVYRTFVHYRRVHQWFIGSQTWLVYHSKVKLFRRDHLHILYVPGRTRAKLVAWILTIPHHSSPKSTLLNQDNFRAMGGIFWEPSPPNKERPSKMSSSWFENKYQIMIVRNCFFLSPFASNMFNWKCSTFKQVVLCSPVFLPICLNEKVTKAFQRFMKPCALCRLLGVLQPFNPYKHDKSWKLGLKNSSGIEILVACWCSCPTFLYVLSFLDLIGF